MKLFTLSCACFLVGCIGIPRPHPRVEAAPAPSPVVIDSCEQTRNWHNAWIILGTTFGGLSGGSGTVGAAVSDKNAKLGLSIGAAITGVFAAVSTVAAGITADMYSSEHCQAVLEQAFSEKQ